jgi:hypothetical protein
LDLLLIKNFITTFFLFLFAEFQRNSPNYCKGLTKLIESTIGIDYGSYNLLTSLFDYCSPVTATCTALRPLIATPGAASASARPNMSAGPAASAKTDSAILGTVIENTLHTGIGRIFSQCCEAGRLLLGGYRYLCLQLRLFSPYIGARKNITYRIFFDDENVLQNSILNIYFFFINYGF